MDYRLEALMTNISKVVVGKEDIIEFLSMALLCQGHVLIEDVPGTGKTTLALALAKSIGGSFNRISCTPDVMPSDITGFSMYNPKNQQFEYHEGTIMSNVFLVDEINRTTPKTQSGLLEAMEEGRVTVDGHKYDLPSPFMVLATQNPVEHLGTYPLPEAQLDRFIIKVSIGYPEFTDEVLILRRFKEKNPLETIEAVISTSDLEMMQEEVLKVHVDLRLDEYMIKLARLTREHTLINLGISPRGTLFLSKMARASAYMEQRDYVIPDDIKKVFLPVCAHRILPKAEARYENMSPESLLSDVLKKVKIPEGIAYGS